MHVPPVLLPRSVNCVDTTVRRGDIYYADLSPVVGSEQGGVRPVLIVQNDTGNRHSPTVIAAAITSQLGKAKLPTHRAGGAGQRSAQRFRDPAGADTHAGQKAAAGADGTCGRRGDGKGGRGHRRQLRADRPPSGIVSPGINKAACAYPCGMGRPFLRGKGSPNVIRRAACPTDELGKPFVGGRRPRRPVSAERCRLRGWAEPLVSVSVV